ncbi:MAG: VOC family protein [Kineosporiaceae bacterium]|nr:VOC family protein [Aeromicrobium sp.]
MALISFKDLCFDAQDPVLLGTFWGAALGLHGEALDDGDMRLLGNEKAQSIWINRVAEAKTVKHRVHLDVNGRSVAEYEAMGARLLPDWGPFDWTVMADPEGGEFCLFERDRPPARRHSEIEPSWDDAYRLYELGVDAADAGLIGSWWAEAFGAPLRGSDRDFYSLEGIEGCPFDSIVFISVPEPKTIKNRIHWDVTLVGEATVDDLVDTGATILRAQDEEISWTVMADPEGNEFCVFATLG